MGYLQKKVKRNTKQTDCNSVRYGNVHLKTPVCASVVKSTAFFVVGVVVVILLFEIWARIGFKRF